MKKARTLLLWLLMCCFLVFPAFAETVAQVPNDPYYSQQWALEAIHWLPVWQQGLTGKGVKIGIIDSGAVAGHEDLQNTDLQGCNFNRKGVDDSEPFTNDVIGHGTFVTGVIAAQPDNGKGIAGIAPGAEIYSYRAFSEKEGSVETVLHAIDQAIEDGCQIINLSMGMPRSTPKLMAGIQKAQEAGILIVAAVGNGNYGITTTLYPAGYEGVIGVGSVDEQLERSSFSQRNESVFVVAPGQQIASLDYTDITGYVTGSGTSYAAPVVTAMAALALEYDPNLTQEELTEMLRLTATDLGEPGYDTSYGHGLVNVAAFIEGLQTHFSVRYQLSAGAFSEEVPLFYRAAEGLSQLPVPVCENHVFAGWYADAEGAEPVEAISAGTLGAQTIYGKWTPTDEGLCSDADGDHACDICGTEITNCQDGEDADTLCDICGQNLLQIRVEGNLLVVENAANVQLIIAEYDRFGKMIGVQMVTEGANVPIRGQTRVFTLNKNYLPQLPWLEVHTDSAAAQ